MLLVIYKLDNTYTEAIGEAIAKLLSSIKYRNREVQVSKYNNTKHLPNNDNRIKDSINWYRFGLAM